MRKVAIEYNKTPEAIAHQKLFGIDSEDFAIEIPTLCSIGIDFHFRLVCHTLSNSNKRLITASSPLSFLNS